MDFTNSTEIKIKMSDLKVTLEEMPDWLTANFLSGILSIPENFVLGRIEHACAKGDNFASKIYRVEIVFVDGKSKSLVVKASPVGSGFSEEFVKKFKIFPKEIEMYDNVQLFEKHFHTVGHEITFAPK